VTACLEQARTGDHEEQATREVLGKCHQGGAGEGHEAAILPQRASATAGTHAICVCKGGKRRLRNCHAGRLKSWFVGSSPAALRPHALSAMCRRLGELEQHVDSSLVASVGQQPSAFSSMPHLFIQIVSSMRSG